MELSLRSWGKLAAAGAVAVGAIALASGACSDSRTVTKTVTVRPPTKPAEATLPFKPVSNPHGAKGSVSIRGGRGSLLNLTITVSAPQRYGVVLWTNSRQSRGLYSGHPGQNTQVLSISGQALLRYRWVEVGQQLVRTRIVHRRVHGRRVRYRQRYLFARHLLRVPSTKLVNKLVAAAPPAVSGK